jgi:hypothetical protein
VRPSLSGMMGIAREARTGNKIIVVNQGKLVIGIQSGMRPTD